MGASLLALAKSIYYSAIQYVNYIIMGQANEKMKLTCLLETIFHDVLTGHCLIFPS